MSFKISIASDPTVSFEVHEGQSILDGAHEAGIDIPSCCENGICATCKGCVLSGDIEYPDIQPEGLMDGEAEEGLALFCSAHPLTDCTIDHPEMLLPGEFPARFFKTHVTKKTQIDQHTVSYQFGFDSKIPFRFLPGQYVELVIGTERFPLSITNQPNEGYIDCHITYGEHRSDAKSLVDKIDNAQKLMIYGPMGRAYLRQQLKKPVVLLAGGGGITPMLSILEASLSLDVPVYLYWGARHPSLYYGLERLMQLKEKHSQLNLIFAISDPHDDWSGETGNIHEVLLEQLDNIKDPVIYMAGPAEMIKSAYKDLSDRGIPRDQFFSDAFSYLKLD